MDESARDYLKTAAYHYPRKDLWKKTWHSIFIGFLGLSISGLYWFWPWNLLGVGLVIIVYSYWKIRVWSKWKYEIVVSSKWISINGNVIDWNEVTEFTMDRDEVRTATLIHYSRMGKKHCFRIDSRLNDYPLFVHQCARIYSDKWAHEQVGSHGDSAPDFARL